MTTITITDVEETRVGDYVTLRDYSGHEWSGIAWSDSDALLIGSGDVVRYYAKARFAIHGFVSATREIPDLPTSPGSVIIADARATKAGTSWSTRVKLFRLCTGTDLDGENRCWIDPFGLRYRDEDILDWYPISAA